METRAALATAAGMVLLAATSAGVLVATTGAAENGAEPHVVTQYVELATLDPGAVSLADADPLAYADEAEEYEEYEEYEEGDYDEEHEEDDHDDEY